MATLSPFTLLMVDDDDEDVYTLRRAARQLEPNCDFRHVEDADGLFAYLGRKAAAGDDDFAEPDLIFLDINLPRVTGFEILERLRGGKDFPLLPVLVFTTSNSAADARRCYDIGANAVFTKPARFDETLRIVRSAVEFWSAPGLRRP